MRRNKFISDFPYKAFLTSLTEAPGVYQMLDKTGKMLYIGKARNLKKRLASYFQNKIREARLMSMISQIHQVEVIVTRNENEALLLENQLIKKHHPHYNILLRDDKSYPYIVLSKHAYPKIFSRRGEKYSREDQVFGPYPSGTAVRKTLKFIQKTFKLRVCRDSFFNHRSRPCLLYQIKKCTAPCTGYISKENYLEEVKSARLLLMGKNQEVMNHLIARMEDAAALQAYETAAQLRDQIAYLRHIQTRQIVTKEKGNCDVFAVITAQGLTAAALLFIREGNVSGSRIFYLAEEMAEQFAPASAEILSAFIPQYYAEPALPVLSLEVITREKLADKEWLEKALKINIKQARHGEKLAWVKMAEKTGMEALKAKLAVNQQYARRLEELQQLLHLPVLPANMVCFDISHSSGEATMASCVVFDQKGPLKKAWRKYTIRNIQKNDDYAAMYQVLERFFSRQKNLPDIVFIDGGKGQLTQAEKVCAALNIPDIKMVAIAKGASRKPGFEQLFVSGDKVPLDTFPYPEALHLIQYIRDEAHRFAIQAHRKKRAKNRLTSVLDTIPGIGTKRRKELLRQLGGLQEIKRASIEQLQSVTGINTSLAEKIYQTLHESG